ncbi:MAG: DNA methyltransferase [Chloroflexota bacterium]|nr:DNA methyltransferase [Chloroflexota bacterium]
MEASLCIQVPRVLWIPQMTSRSETGYKGVNGGEPMSQIHITRTELVWPGKYDEEGNLVPPRRVNLPFQVIERINETRGTREKREEDREGHVATLFDYWRAEEEQRAPDDDGWRNKLIWGDNLYVMGSLLEHFAGKVDLVYIDPPYATGADFSFRTRIGNEQVTRKQSVIEEEAYRDTWRGGAATYLAMVHKRLQLVKDLLAPGASLFVHLDYRMDSYVRLVLDELFSRDNLRNEIVWCYTGPSQTSRYFPQKHDMIYWYTKGEPWVFNTELLRVPYKKSLKSTGSTSVIGRASDDELEELDDRGKLIEDWWSDIATIGYIHKEITGYDTQKPEGLLERIITATSEPGDLVADFFCGSGTTLAVAEKLGRRWIGCDLSRYAIHTTRKRLMEIPDASPFEVLNLGKYERQIWQGISFGGDKRTQQILIFEYLKFILELYGAQPLAGTEHLHGKKGSAMVHVGAVDAPVTIDEINACLAECKAMDQSEIHVLGWEWEMGLANLMVEEAEAQGIKLLLLKIPREVMEQQAVDKGAIKFYELAYLETHIEIDDGAVTVELTDFVIPNDELVPDEVREKVTKWSDFVDYWAVDWDFQNDAFLNGWTSYRTRQDPTLKLKTDRHVYGHPGTYRIMVKVIDIFGNDTSQVFEVEVA